MSKPKRHVGRLINTDRRCVVVFMQIPQDPNNALIVDTDGLPDFIHESLFKLVDSNDAQQEVNLSDVLCRRISPEPSIDMLTYLHTRGLLHRVPTSNVMMYPLPNQPILLQKLIEMMGGTVATKVADRGVEEKFNPVLDNQRIEGLEASISLAKGKIQEAELLEFEAKKKREEAYAMVPQLRPNNFSSTTHQTPVRVEQPVPHIEPVSEDIPSEYAELIRKAEAELNAYVPPTEEVVVEEVVVKEPKKRGRKKSS